MTLHHHHHLCSQSAILDSPCRKLFNSAGSPCLGPKSTMQQGRGTTRTCARSSQQCSKRSRPQFATRNSSLSPCLQVIQTDPPTALAGSFDSGLAPGTSLGGHSIPTNTLLDSDSLSHLLGYETLSLYPSPTKRLCSRSRWYTDVVLLLRLTSGPANRSSGGSLRTFSKQQSFEANPPRNAETRAWKARLPCGNLSCVLRSTARRLTRCDEDALAAVFGDRRPLPQ